MEPNKQPTLDELRTLANDPALSPRAVLEIRQKRLKLLEAREKEMYGPNA